MVFFDSHQRDHTSISLFYSVMCPRGSGGWRQGEESERGRLPSSHYRHLTDACLLLKGVPWFTQQILSGFLKKWLAVCGRMISSRGDRRGHAKGLTHTPLLFYFRMLFYMGALWVTQRRESLSCVCSRSNIFLDLAKCLSKRTHTTCLPFFRNATGTRGPASTVSTVSPSAQHDNKMKSTQLEQHAAKLNIF